ncbi:MAG TPA: YfiR family protein [Pseudomonadales bacterium]|nr:YfiR family protein [Pseudomonadales bacterium]
MTRIRPALIKAAVLLLGLVFATGFRCHAQPTEYQIKAAFIYNFARFVEWPAEAFASTNSPMVIGVLGKNVFEDSLQRTINGKVIKGHPLQFKAFNSPEEATNCHVLFISTSEKNRMPKILAQLQGTSILTVTENTDTFTASGGMINLVIVEDKVRFQINNDAAKKSGLIISSKLLSLAVNSP